MVLGVDTHAHIYSHESYLGGTPTTGQHAWFKGTMQRKEAVQPL